MKRYLVVIATLAMVLAACGDSDSGSADTCEGLVDQGIDLIQDALDEVSGMSLEELAAMGDDLPPGFAELETRGEELERRSDELGCTEAELNRLFTEKADDLEADGPFAELILEGIKSEGFFQE